LYDFLSNSRTDKDLSKVLAALEKSSNAAAHEILNAVADSSSQDQLDSFLSTSKHMIEVCQNVLKFFKATFTLLLSLYFQKYPTTGRKKALIINVLKNRKGAEKDTTALTETLQRCGFQVVSCWNFTEKVRKMQRQCNKSQLSIFPILREYWTTLKNSRKIWSVSLVVLLQ
jgi:hypothetical protein